MARFNADKWNTSRIVLTKKGRPLKGIDASPRTCSQCKLEKPGTKEFFITRADRPWLFLAGCRDCRNKRRQEHKFKRYDLYQRELRIRSRVRRKVCAECNVGGDIHWHVLQGKTALYHSKCIQDKWDELGVISPKRAEELRQIAGSMA